MKFRCERDVLVEALGIAGRAVSGRGGLPGLAGVRAELRGDDLTLTGSDLDLTISISITVAGESDGVAIVPARLAADIVKSLAPGAVSLAAEADEFTIQSGRSDFSIRLISGDEFPKLEISSERTVSLPADLLSTTLKQVVTAASSDDSRPILTGVLMVAEGDGVRLVATDSYRLSMKDLAGTDVLNADQSVLIPSKALRELERVLSQGENVEINLGERDASFKVGSVTLVTRLIEGDFPNYKGLLPDSHPNLLTVNRDELLDALRRVKLLAREATPVRLEMSSDGVELVAVTQDVGTAREQIEGTYDGDPLTVAFNPQYLLEGIEVTPGESVTLATIDGLRPAVMRSEGEDDFLYLLMPVRVS